MKVDKWPHEERLILLELHTQEYGSHLWDAGSQEKGNWSKKERAAICSSFVQICLHMTVDKIMGRTWQCEPLLILPGCGNSFHCWHFFTSGDLHNLLHHVCLWGCLCLEILQSPLVWFVHQKSLNSASNSATVLKGAQTWKPVWCFAFLARKRSYNSSRLLSGWIQSWRGWGKVSPASKG